LPVILMTPESSFTMIALLSGGLAWCLAARRTSRRQQRYWETQLKMEQTRGQQLCLSTIEALTSAIDARDPYNIGHVECVKQCALAIARALSLSEEEMAALQAAAMLHNIGRLGVPDHIFLKADTLTPEEQEKLRTHPVLGARILASIPFPWPVVPLVRHHAEHWDGSGYPDGLKGEEIPVGARILAVANTYSALLHPRPFRQPLSPKEAIAEIEARAGTQFDPAVVAAFRTLAVQKSLEAIPADAFTFQPSKDAQAVLHDIAAAQRETLALYTITRALSETLHLEAMADVLLHHIQALIGCDACALFLPEEGGEYLHAHAAVGLNARHLLGSVARVGTYLTGRAFFRAEAICASFLPEDLILRDVSDPWVPFRSTLIVPLVSGGQSLGTINLYSELPDAFNSETLRIMRLVATQASHALERAQQFSEIQESAYTDALTGLRNARYLREYLEREINRANRENGSLAVLNIDVDHFKPINDLYGHATGDQTLKDLADIFRNHVRNYDLAARYAGDEFVVVLARADRVAAEVVATKLRRAVERYVRQIQQHDPDFPPLGISIGVALYPEDAMDIQGLLCRSDAAMYADKRARRSSHEAA